MEKDRLKLADKVSDMVWEVMLVLPPDRARELAQTIRRACDSAGLAQAMSERRVR